MNSRIKKSILISVLILFAVLFLSIPFQHDHTESVVGADDCPANVLQMNILSAVVFFGVLLKSAFPARQLKDVFFHTIIPEKIYFQLQVKRAPPQA